MFNLLQGSSYTSLSNRQTNFINKEIDSLESKRNQLAKKIREMQNSKNTTAHLKSQLQNQQKQVQQSSSVFKNAKIKLEKYKIKKIDMQNKRMAEIIVYQQLQIQLQSLKKQLLEIFTLKSNQLQTLRFKLIQIESDQQIVKFSEQFSLRKIVLLFLKKNKIEVRDVQTLELQIAKRSLIEQFRGFIQDYLKSKKLNEFRKLFKEPIQRYIKTLQQIKQIESVQKLSNIHDQEKQQLLREKLIDQWNSKKHQLMAKKNQIDSIDYKIQQINKKMKKYDQEMKESVNKQKQFQYKIKYYSQIKEVQKQDDKILSKLKIELKQLNQAVYYLNSKRNHQNSNFLNSPKSMGYIDNLEHSKISNSVAPQNCELSNSNVMSHSTKYSDASLLKSPKSRVPKDKLSSTLKKSSSPIFR